LRLPLRYGLIDSRLRLVLLRPLLRSLPMLLSTEPRLPRPRLKPMLPLLLQELPRLMLRLPPRELLLLMPLMLLSRD